MKAEVLENKLNEVGIIAFRCNEDFYGMYMPDRDGKLSDRKKIHSEGETFTICNDKNIGAFGDTFYRMNNTKSMFFEGMVLIGSIARGIENGVLEVIEDYKKPKVTVYSLEDVLPVNTVAMN